MPVNTTAKLVTAVWFLVSSCALAQSDAANRLLRDKACLACHAWEQKLVGPAYLHVRARYELDDYFAFLVAKVRDGGNGSWGSVPMPAHPQLSKAEGEYLVASILGLSGYVAPTRAASKGDDPPSVGRVFRLK
jgi:cytochrome c